MIIGTVLSSRDAVIPLRIHLEDGSSLEIKAVIDTGFTEALALPAELIQKLGLIKRSESVYTLADGSTVSMRNCEAAIEWFDSLRRIVVAEIDGAPLIGMQMLRGSRLTIDVTPNGRVVIEPLPALS